MTTALLALVHHDLARTRDALTLRSDPGDFAGVLGAVATVVVGVCALWIWCITTSATLEALHGVHDVELRGLRGGVRRLVLAGCGVALAAAVAPAQADDLGTVAGQPPQPITAGASPVSGDHTVHAGDSLWSISAAHLGPGATDADITREWHSLWRANAATVGEDPDLIEPGQRLQLPETHR
jgi:LysM repeat protein